MQPDLLKQLRDVHLPAPISGWPLAPGWYVLLVVVLLIITGIGLYWRKQHRKKLHRQYIIKKFHALNRVNDIAGTMALIKQVALMLFPNENLANLQGSAWLTFLQQHNRHVQLSRVEITQFSTIAYRANAQIDPRFTLFLQTWLEQQL